MSSPQPPNQPWQGGPPPQQGEGEQSQEQRPGQPPHQDNPALSTPGPTQALQPGQPAPHQVGADGVERTQAIQPGQQPGGGEATQIVNPVNYGQRPQQPDSGQTQMVPPGSMPPQQPPYAPPPGADSQGPGGFGQQQGGFGQQQPPPGYGPPPGGFAQQQGLGAGPTFGGQGQNLQMISWGIAGLAALFGLLVAIFALVDFGDLGDYADGYNAAPDELVDQINAPSPGMLWLCTIAVLLGALGAIGGGVLIYLKHKLATMALAVGGGLMLVFGIFELILIGGIKGDVGSLPNTGVWGLIGGIVVGAAGALGFIPQTKKYLGGESVLGGSGGPPSGGFGGPPSGGFGQQQPPQQGFGGPPSGGFGQQPQQGFGQPPQQGGPPQQW